MPRKASDSKREAQLSKRDRQASRGVRAARARAANLLRQGHRRAVVAGAEPSPGTSRAPAAMCGVAAI